MQATESTSCLKALMQSTESYLALCKSLLDAGDGASVSRENYLVFVEDEAATDDVASTERLSHFLRGFDATHSVALVSACKGGYRLVVNLVCSL